MNTQPVRGLESLRFRDCMLASFHDCKPWQGIPAKDLSDLCARNHYELDNLAWDIVVAKTLNNIPVAALPILSYCNVDFLAFLDLVGSSDRDFFLE
jgi:hypothetical protein